MNSLSDTSEARLQRLRKLQFIFVIVAAVGIPAVIVVVSILFAPSDPATGSTRTAIAGVFASGFGCAALAMMSAIGYTVGQRRSGASCAILALIYLGGGIGIASSLG